MPKPPFPAYEIRQTDPGAIVVFPVKVLELLPQIRVAIIERRTGSFLIRTNVSFDDLVSTIEAVASRVSALLAARSPEPASAVEPPQPSVAGPAQKPEAAETAAA